MGHLREMLELEKQRSLADLRRELQEHERLIETLKEEMSRMNETLAAKEDELEFEKKNHLSKLREIMEEHKRGIESQSREFDREKLRIEDHNKHELQRIKSDFAKKLDAINDQHEVSKIYDVVCFSLSFFAICVFIYIFYNPFCVFNNIGATTTSNKSRK